MSFQFPVDILGEDSESLSSQFEQKYNERLSAMNGRLTVSFPPPSVEKLIRAQEFVKLINAKLDAIVKHNDSRIIPGAMSLTEFVDYAAASMITRTDYHMGLATKKMVIGSISDEYAFDFMAAVHRKLALCYDDICSSYQYSLGKKEVKNPSYNNWLKMFYISKPNSIKGHSLDKLFIVDGSSTQSQEISGFIMTALPALTCADGVILKIGPSK